MEPYIPGSLQPDQGIGLQGHHTPVLRRSESVTVQVDASKKGLGAALLQEGCPVAFASKALTPTEQRYANIEREMLACVFGAERFHTYVFGREFTIESDHKPLEQINLKNLADTPARLQRMLLRLQNYDVTIKYRPGKEMLVADALSRYSPLIGPEVTLDIAIHHVHITPEKKLEFQRTIQDDPLLHTLADTIVAGWPEDIKDIPKALRSYHNHRDVMNVEDGLILKGEALVIPPLEREKILQGIHEGHMESPSASTVQDNVYIGLESMKISGKWLKHAQHVNAIAHRNQDSHSNQPQHQNAHGNT